VNLAADLRLKELLLILTAAASLTTTAIAAQAGIGWTKAQCDAYYKDAQKTEVTPGTFFYQTKAAIAIVFFLNNKVGSISYLKFPEHNSFSNAELNALLQKNGSSWLDLRQVPVTPYNLSSPDNWTMWLSKQNPDLLIQISKDSSILKIATTEAYEAQKESLKQKAQKDTDGM
jgi:hypothetical protein